MSRAVTYKNEKDRKQDLRHRKINDFKFKVAMVIHGLFWGFLHKTYLATPYSKFMCYKNWYRKYPDGRCGYCGNSHNKIKEEQ